MKTVQSFYVDSRACVRVGNDVSKWFPVNVELNRSVCCLHGCFMNIWMVWLGRVLGKGLVLLSANGVRFEITSCYLQIIQH